MIAISQTTHDAAMTATFGKDYHKLGKDRLRFELVQAQYELRQTRTQGQATGLLLLINGIELSGKGSAVAQLREWMDPRLLNVEATLGELPAQYEPIWQSHTPKLPKHGNVTAYFGNWYADLMMAGLHRLQAGEDWQQYVQQKIDQLAAFEHDLSRNHTQILKCWFDIDDATLRTRLTDADPDPTGLYHLNWQDAQAVDNYRQVSQYILQQQSHWHHFDGATAKSFVDHSDLPFTQKMENTFALYVLDALQQTLRTSRQHSEERTKSSTPPNHSDTATLDTSAAFSWADIPDKLTDIDDPDMDKADYKAMLSDKQARLAMLLRQRKITTSKDATAHAGHVIFAFEGMDAAGKGGAIKRLVSALDPREYQIYNIGAPTATELQHPYLWRFWTRLPQFEPGLKYERLSRTAIFDRTWYGRVLVERIENFAAKEDWQRAYDEINRMEADLHAHGTVIIKYWLAIDKQEQLERFEDRQDTPHKRYKLTQDDWRNRGKWHDYVQAAADMLARTNTSYAPWHVVATNDKRTARLAVLDHAIKRLEDAKDASR